MIQGKAFVYHDLYTYKDVIIITIRCDSQCCNNSEHLKALIKDIFSTLLKCFYPYTRPAYKVQKSDFH